MLTLTQLLPPDPQAIVQTTLSLTADDRTRSRHCFKSTEGLPLYLNLPRGTVLRHGDLLQADDQSTLVRVLAEPEAVMTVTAAEPLALLRAAYHLGNRHVALEVTTTYLRFSPDPVLKAMLEQMGLQVTEATLPFQPETGAYGNSHGHSHGHSHPSSRESSHHHTHAPTS